MTRIKQRHRLIVVTAEELDQLERQIDWVYGGAEKALEDALSLIAEIRKRPRFTGWGFDDAR
jgi:hypothetical protein